MAIVRVNLDSILDIIETLTLNQDLAGDPQVTHTIASTSVVLKPTTSPVVTSVWSDNRNVTAGKLDLIALPNTTLPNIDMTGLKVHAIQIKTAAANAALINFKFGAANPYNIFGAAGTLDVHPGSTFLLYAPEILPDVAAGAKDIDVAGTGADLYDVIIIAG